MDTKPGRKANLKKYLAHYGKWQFFQVVKVNGRPKPELVLIDGKPRRSPGGTGRGLSLNTHLVACAENGSKLVSELVRTFVKRLNQGGLCRPTMA